MHDAQGRGIHVVLVSYAITVADGGERLLP